MDKDKFSESDKTNKSFRRKEVQTLLDSVLNRIEFFLGNTSVDEEEEDIWIDLTLGVYVFDGTIFFH